MCKLSASSPPRLPPDRVATPPPSRPSLSAAPRPLSPHLPPSPSHDPSPPPLDPFPTPQQPPRPDDQADLFFFEDEGLSSLEKIYLFSRSKEKYHRVFISRSLHTFLPHLSPLEAVEYVLPLLNGLALDDEDAVKEALVTNLISVMWWFFENCQLIEEEPPELVEPHDPPLLPVQTFTPILGSLLIDHNTMVASPARFTVVDLLNRLRAAESTPHVHPGPNERNMLEHEIVHQVIIGMARLDLPDDIEHHSPIVEPAASSPPEVGSPSLPEHTALQPAALLSPVPALSPDSLSLSPDSSPLGPTSPALQNQESHVSFASTDPIANWVPPSPHAPEHDAWLTADPQDDASEQAAIGRLSSMSLIATVTANATLPEETIRAFTDEVVCIGGDPLYWVRREASFAVGALAKVVPAELVQLTLLPLFDALAHDAVWHVRHSAVFALPGILARLAPAHRRTLALDTLHRLAGDTAPTVRSGMLEVLGEVIYTFHGDEGGAPSELVALFVGRDDGHGTERWLSDPTVSKPRDPLSSVFEGDDEGEGESPIGMFGPSLTTPGGFFHDPARALITSFNYPAVALTLGAPRWGEIRPYYLALARDGNVRVRRTIAASLGEMARILGPALAARDLLSVWDDMVHDGNDGETRLKALRGGALFVGALEGAARARVLGSLGELWERWLRGWRERECVAGALPALAPVAGAQGEVVRVLLEKALVDGMAAVREAAIGAVAPVLGVFADRPHLADAVRDDLHALACADVCRKRATYVACYRELVESEHGKAEISRDQFWDRILVLSKDYIVDVRIGVARLLGVICEKFYPEPPERPAPLSESVRRLAQDPSRDVRAFVAFWLVPGAPLYSPALERVVTPPMTFATFSRPPPRPAEGVRDLDIGENLLDLAAQVGHGASRRGEDMLKDTVWRSSTTPAHKKSEGEAASSDLVKPRPLGVQRRRSDDWERS